MTLRNIVLLVTVLEFHVTVEPLPRSHRISTIYFRDFGLAFTTLKHRKVCGAL